MAGRVDDLQLDLAGFDGVPVADEDVRGRRGLCPEHRQDHRRGGGEHVGVALVDDDLRAGLGLHVGVARDVVDVPVGVHDGADREAALPGLGDDPVRLRRGVDHEALPRLFVADDVGEDGHVAHLELLENHVLVP